MRELKDARTLADRYSDQEERRLQMEKQARQKQGSDCKEDWRQRLRAKQIKEQVARRLKDIEHGAITNTAQQVGRNA
jgi:putative component of toxin-antitoxin plasmid stabilization module